MSQSTGKLAQYLRKIPGAAQLEGAVEGALAEESDLPIADYDKATATEITDRLGGLSQLELAKIDAYERRTKNRATVLAKVTALRGTEPWSGYDELTVGEIQKVLAAAGDDQLKAVRKYERAHKNRSTVVRAAGD